jgi:DHA1 family bicyclomycin/chloramphenicol resistance-like MFS transporter
LAPSLSCVFPKRFRPKDFHPVAAGHGLLATLAKVRFVAYTAVFGLIASAQLVFGVVAPFLYQQKI